MIPHESIDDLYVLRRDRISEILAKIVCSPSASTVQISRTRCHKDKVSKNSEPPAVVAIKVFGSTRQLSQATKRMFALSAKCKALCFVVPSLGFLNVLA